MTLGRPGSFRDLLAVGSGEGEPAMAIGVDTEAAFMNEAMVAAAEKDKVGRARLATVRPVANVVTVHEAAL